MTMTQLDTQSLRQALAGMATPVVVVTTTVDGTDYGFTANSFTSVSMDPPLLGVYLADTASCLEAFLRAERVAFNILADHQAQVARQFATSGADKFAGLEVHDDLPGVPAIAGSMVSLAGDVVERIVLGDHVLLLVAPTDSTDVQHSPLIYHQRGFHTLPVS